MTAQHGSFLATRRGRLILLLACAFFLLAAAVIGLRAANTRGEPAPHPDDMPASHDRIPAPELTD